ncbi:MAG: A/G-specific adenine glycosylase [Oscillospiraceae bacterium]
MPQQLNIAQPLLQWYYKNRRILPFREDPTPYHIWLSEIMLQQTRVAAALDYYNRFIQELPDIASLAACDEEKLHKLWEGLGYYSRVRNLQKAAQVVMQQYNGELPDNYEKLLALPGIGPYTAGAISSIAFNLPHVAVDGNVLRVFSRLLAFPQNVEEPTAKSFLTNQVQDQQPSNLPGDFNQALMELGALVCLPGTPKCEICPLQNQCRGFKQGIAQNLPYKEKKPPKKIEEYTVLVVQVGSDAFVLQQRPPKGLLAGLWQPVLYPGHLALNEAELKLKEVLPQVQLVQTLPASEHVFTHKVWKMQGWLFYSPPANAPKGYILASSQQILNQLTLPGAFKAYLPYLLQSL